MQYYLSTFTANYHMASKWCKAWGGNLASITSKKEQDMIYKNIDKRRVYWIGLDDLTKEKNFNWADGQKSGFRYWAAGEPNDYGRGEDCTTVNWHKN
jgi:hypothetical protein